jgi:hypothetical protein
MSEVTAKPKKERPADKLPSTELIQSSVTQSRQTTLAPKTFDEAIRFAKMLADSTMVPEAYQGMPANVLVAMQYGAELGLNPLQSVQNVAMIGGRPCIWGDAMLGLIKANPLCTDIIERKEGSLADETRTAFCTVKRVGKADVTVSFSVEDAKRAGLWSKAGTWKLYPDRMLMWRARGFACRDQFPDVLKGIVSYEEARDMRAQVIDSTFTEEPDVITMAKQEPVATALPGLDQTIPPEETFDPETGELHLSDEPYFGGDPPAKTFRQVLERLPKQLAACNSRDDVVGIRDRPDVLHAIEHAKRELKLQILDLIGEAAARFSLEEANQAVTVTGPNVERNPN